MLPRDAKGGVTIYCEERLLRPDCVVIAAGLLLREGDDLARFVAVFGQASCACIVTVRGFARALTG